MSCTTPQVPPKNKELAVKFAKEFAEQTSNFTKPLQLPSPMDPSVLAMASKTAGYFVDELEKSDIVQPFIEDSIARAIIGQPSIKVDTSAIAKDLFNVFNAFVAGAKATPTFSGYSSTTYFGKYGERDVIYKILLAVNIANASEVYDSAPRIVLEIAYSAFLTVQKADPDE